MSAIVGVYKVNGQPVDPTHVARMLGTLTHRGPDGCGSWVQGAVGLGHRMLHTTPESLHERQPLSDKAGNMVLTCDARIDNREELIRSLDLTGRRSGEITDSELVLAAYEKWGEACPKYLLGDFGFALWDARRQALFCARDHFGLKPFYYHASDRVFAFGSEIKALVCLPDVPCRLNETRVFDFLMSEYDDKEITFYQGILRLPPAHTLTVTREGTRLECYWELDPGRELNLRSDAEYAEGFREVFTDAVRCRLRSAFPVGSMLSGGLDSSSITCVARDLLMESQRGLLHTFSAIFDDTPECDERRYINAVLARGGFSAHAFQAGEISPLVDVERVLWHLDEPLSANNLNLVWSVYRSAADQNVRVVLDGLDGDTTVSHGEGYLTELARSGRWLRLIREAHAYNNRKGRPAGGHLRRLVRQHGRAGLIRSFGPLGRDYYSRAVSRSRTRARNAPAPLHWNPGTPPLNYTSAMAAGARERLERFSRDRSETIETEREAHFRSLNRGVCTHMLGEMEHAAAAFSLEARSPFCDRRLIEYCLSLPGNQKLDSGWDRIVLRRSMDGVLPPDVQWRPGKVNFTSYFDRGLVAHESGRLASLLLQGGAELEPYLDVELLRPICRGLLSSPDNAGEYDTTAVWKAASLALWLRQAGLTV